MPHRRYLVHLFIAALVVGGIFAWILLGAPGMAPP